MASCFATNSHRSPLIAKIFKTTCSWHDQSRPVQSSENTRIDGNRDKKCRSIFIEFQLWALHFTDIDNSTLYQNLWNFPHLWKRQIQGIKVHEIEKTSISYSKFPASCSFFIVRFPIMCIIHFILSQKKDNFKNSISDAHSIISEWCSEWCKMAILLQLSL